jgi:hypothetical protein
MKGYWTTSPELALLTEIHPARLRASIPVSRANTEESGEMNDIRMNNAYGADGGLQAGGAARTAGHWSAAVVEESAAAVAPSSRPAASPIGPSISPPAQRSGRAPEGAAPLRLVQVYLTPVIDDFLRHARSIAIVKGLDVSASAVVRHAMERLMAAASPAEMVELLGSPKEQSQRRRGRPRRLTQFMHA